MWIWFNKDEFWHSKIHNYNYLLFNWVVFAYSDVHKRNNSQYYSKYNQKIDYIDNPTWDNYKRFHCLALQDPIRVQNYLSIEIHHFASARLLPLHNLSLRKTNNCLLNMKTISCFSLLDSLFLCGEYIWIKRNTCTG